MKKDDPLTSLISHAGSSSRWQKPSIEILRQLKPGKIAVTIHADGRWSYRDSVFERPSMVALLANSLVYLDDEYYLIAPEQLLKISVEDLPFLIVDMTRTFVDKIEDEDFSVIEKSTQTDNLSNTGIQQIRVSTNLGEQLLLGCKHSLALSKPPNSDTEIPQIDIRDGLQARFSRACFYQLVEWGEESEIEGRPVIGVFSNGVSHTVGYLD